MFKAKQTTSKIKILPHLALVLPQALVGTQQASLV